MRRSSRHNYYAFNYRSALMPEKKSSNTLLRQWEMLRLLPKAPSPQATVKQIREKLANVGFGVDDRTVQRDLKSLAAVFPIDVQDRAPPYGWRWNRDAHFDIPSMPLSEALALELVEQYLQPLLPLSQIDVLQGMFQASRQKLNGVGAGNPLSQWSSRVRVVQASQPFIAPKVGLEVQSVIYEGLLKRRQVSVNYRNANDELKEGMPLHLLGLVQRGPVTFLIARARDYNDNRIFDLHRVESAKLLDEMVNEPDDFDLDEYLATGALEFSQAGKRIAIELRLHDRQARLLKETPISIDQKITLDLQEGWSRLVATVNDTVQLRWWLRSLGERCEVLGPSEIREEFICLARGLCAIYQDKGITSRGDTAQKAW